MASSTAVTRLRHAFAIEASLNVIGGITMLAYPSTILSYLMSHPTLITNSSVMLMQWLGALSCGLAAPLLLALPDSPQAPDRRRLTYWTLLAGEGSLIPVFAFQAAAANDGTGFTRKALMVSLQVLSAQALGRLYVLLGRPGWFGGQKSAGKVI